MTYTKKRIIVDADVPDGATHFRLGGFRLGGLTPNFEWWKFDHKWRWWSDISHEWVDTRDGFIPQRVEKIEVIE